VLDDSKLFCDYSGKWEESPMADWSIKIVPAKKPTPDRPAEFIADVPGAQPGTFNVETGDLVSWDNQSPQVHWPWPVASQTAPPVDPLPAGLSPLAPTCIKPTDSTDDYSVTAATGKTIWYCCLIHPAERACLVVVPFGQPPDSPPSV
jgi:hypothetical protein